MPKISQETLEASQDVLEISEALFVASHKQDNDTERLIKSFKLWNTFRSVMNVDGRGRVSLRPTLLAARRKAVEHLIKSHTYEEVAKQLGINVYEVHNDVKMLNCRRRKKV